MFGLYGWNSERGGIMLCTHKISTFISFTTPLNYLFQSFSPIVTDDYPIQKEVTSIRQYLYILGNTLSKKDNPKNV